MKTLSFSQRQAVEHTSSPAVVIAGAGSGKTFTAMSKLEYLVNTLGIPPGSILAITFTNKAAEEMKSRVQSTTGLTIESFPWVRTFHSACFQILKLHIGLLGYKYPLSIYQMSQSRTVIKQAIIELGLNNKIDVADILKEISKAKNSGEPRRYLYNSMILEIDKIYQKYNDILYSSNAIDFDDMLLLTKDILLNYFNLRSFYQNQFQYIIVDEFQDTNNVQLDILNLLITNGNITVVGDDYQSIYSFRGANPNQFINFVNQYPTSEIIRLEENYRSTQQIVTASQSLINNNGESQIDKNCYSRRPGRPIYVKGFASDEAEANWVAQGCLNIHNNFNIPFGDISILYRTRRFASKLESALNIAEVKYKVIGAKGFFDRKEIQDILAYLNSALNDYDNVAFKRILQKPPRGIGDKVIKKIQDVSYGLNKSYKEAAAHLVLKGSLPPNVRASLRNLLIFLKSLKNIRTDIAIQRILDVTGYYEYLKTHSKDYPKSEESIEQLIKLAEQKESIPDFLESFSLDPDQEVSSDEADNGKVKLSTVHAAKGLEYQVIFLCGMEEGSLPHFHAVAQNNPHGEEIKEERRIAYVGMTRSTDYLCITYATSRNRMPRNYSRFLSEINKNLFFHI